MICRDDMKFRRTRGPITEIELLTSSRVCDIYLVGNEDNVCGIIYKVLGENRWRMRFDFPSILDNHGALQVHGSWDTLEVAKEWAPVYYAKIQEVTDGYLNNLSDNRFSFVRA